MAEDDERTSGAVPGLIQDFISQLHGVTERLESLTRFGESLPLPAMPGLRDLPRPGAFSAAQLRSISAGVKAQRRSIEAMKTQLTAFDEQLAVFERILEPLAEWSAAWAGLEDRLINVRRGPGAEGQAGGS